MAKPTQVVWQGLEEHRELLRHFPEQLAGESDHIVEAAANAAAFDIRSSYPARTGNLRNGVTVVPLPPSRVGTGRLVTNRAPHALIFEHGTQARHTKLGANRGSMPPGRIFIPRVLRWRRQMYEQIKELLVRRYGAVVTGDAG